MYSFGLSSPSGHKKYKEPRAKFFKKINKSVLSHIICYLEHDDHEAVRFRGETISITCQLKKIQKISMIRLKNETEDLLLSITKNCETLIKQTQSKPEGTLDFKLPNPREILQFNPSCNLGFHSI